MASEKYFLTAGIAERVSGKSKTLFMVVTVVM
jgi:hypothetical protein